MSKNGGKFLVKAFNYFALFFIFFSSFSITFLELFLILSFLTLLVLFFITDNSYKRIFFNELVKITPLWFIFITYIVVYIISSLNGVNYIKSISFLDSEIIKIISFVVSYVVVFLADIEKISLYFTAGGLISAFIGIYQFVYHNFIIDYSGLFRACGKMHAVSYGEIMGIYFIFSLFNYFEYKNRRYGKYYLFATILSGLSLFLSFSRGPLIGIAVGLIAAYLICNNYRILFRRLFIIVIFFGLLILIVRSSSNNLLKNENTNTHFITRDITSMVRLKMWKTGLDIIKDYLLLGVGPYSVSYVFLNYNKEKYLIDNKYYSNDVHNLFLEKVIELGILGGSVYIVMLLYFLYIVYENYKKNRNHISLSSLIVLISFYVMMLTDSSYHLVKTASVVHVIIALSFCRINREIRL